MTLGAPVVASSSRRVGEDLGDASPAAHGDAACWWCRGPRPARAGRWCSKRCRQSAWRARERSSLEYSGDAPIRVAYADPPYPGKAYLYRDQPSYGGEVDHAALIARLVAEYPDGWALSTSAAALRDLLPLCTAEVRVCAWVKSHGALPATRGLHSVWEPLLVYRGRQRPPGKRDGLYAAAARGEGKLIGRKPVAFVCWMFDCLGLQPGDTLDDLFPGTGIVARTWAELSRRPEQLATGRSLSLRARSDAPSPEYSSDAPEDAA